MTTENQTHALKTRRKFRTNMVAKLHQKLSYRGTGVSRQPKKVSQQQQQELFRTQSCSELRAVNFKKLSRQLNVAVTGVTGRIQHLEHLPRPTVACTGTMIFWSYWDFLRTCGCGLKMLKSLGRQFSGQRNTYHAITRLDAQNLLCLQAKPGLPQIFS